MPQVARMLLCAAQPHNRRRWEAPRVGVCFAGRPPDPRLKAQLLEMGGPPPPTPPLLRVAAPHCKPAGRRPKRRQQHQARAVRGVPCALAPRRRPGAGSPVGSCAPPAAAAAARARHRRRLNPLRPLQRGARPRRHKACPPPLPPRLRPSTPPNPQTPQPPRSHRQVTNGGSADPRVEAWSLRAPQWRDCVLAEHAAPLGLEAQLSGRELVAPRSVAGRFEAREGGGAARESFDSQPLRPRAPGGSPGPHVAGLLSDALRLRAAVPSLRRLSSKSRRGQMSARGGASCSRG